MNCRRHRSILYWRSNVYRLSHPIYHTIMKFASKNHQAVATIAPSSPTEILTLPDSNILMTTHHPNLTSSRR